jgi:hypothetical protein
MSIDTKKQADFFSRHPEITRVTPCRDKSPEFRKGWNTEPLTPEQLQRDWPGESFGQVVGPDDLILDFDDKMWFVTNAPSVPETLMIEGRGVRLHARHNDRTRKWTKRKVKNPDSESEWLLEFPNFAVLPPSVHPVTGKEYKENGKPISELSPDWMDFIERLLGERNHKANIFRKNPLKHSWNPEIELPAAGLKFEKGLRDGKVYFNYGWDCRFAGKTAVPSCSTPRIESSGTSALSVGTAVRKFLLHRLALNWRQFSSQQKMPCLTRGMTLRMSRSLNGSSTGFSRRVRSTSSPAFLGDTNPGG